MNQVKKGSDKRNRIGYHRFAYCAGAIGAIMQIGAFIFHARYDTCIYNRAKMFVMAHYLNKKPNDVNDIGVPSASFSMANIMEIIASTEISTSNNYSLRHVDQTVRVRLWKEVYAIIKQIKQYKNELHIDPKALNTLFRYFRQMSSEKQLNFKHNKAILTDIGNTVNIALGSSGLAIGKILLKAIEDLCHTVNGLAVENVYGTLDIIANEYKSAMKITGNDYNKITYKAIQWALIRQHKRNSEEVPMIDKLRLRAMIFQSISTVFFMLSIGLFVVALENHDRKDYKQF